MNEQASSRITANRLFSVVSPCNLAIAFCVVGVIDSWLKMDKSGGWSCIGVLIFPRSIFVLGILDLIIKLIWKGRPVRIWISELLLIVVGLCLFYRFML